MDHLDLLVTLNEEAMGEQLRTDGAAYDIASAVTSAVPSAQIISGAGSVSLHVTLAKGLENKLRNAVSHFCVIDDYGGLDSYGF